MDYSRWLLAGRKKEGSCLRQWGHCSNLLSDSHLQDLRLLWVSDLCLTVPVERYLLASELMAWCLCLPSFLMGYAAAFLWTCCLGAAGHTEYTVKMCQCTVNVLLLTKKDKDGAL